MSEIALSTIAQTTTAWHATFAFLLHSATTITSVGRFELASDLACLEVPTPHVLGDLRTLGLLVCDFLRQREGVSAAGLESKSGRP